jgi:hypothetical protein
MSKKPKTKTVNDIQRETRNWLAVQAHFKTGAGSHGCKKKSDSKKACRGRVDY